MSTVIFLIHVPYDDKGVEENNDDGDSDKPITFTARDENDIEKEQSSDQKEEIQGDEIVKNSQENEDGIELKVTDEPAPSLSSNDHDSNSDQTNVVVQTDSIPNVAVAEPNITLNVPTDETIASTDNNVDPEMSNNKDNLKVDELDPEEEEKERKKSKAYMRHTSYNLSSNLANILEKNSIQRVTWKITKDKEYYEVTFPLESKNSDKVLNELMNAGVGNNTYSSISILPVTVNFPASLIREDIKSDTQFLESVKSRLTVAQVIDVVRGGTQLTFDYIILILMASIIAAVGLLENSSVLLVASMLVSPLMGPILGGTFGIVLQYKLLWKPGILHELFGLAICVIVGFLLGLVCGAIPGWDNVTSEMASRGQARSLYVGVVVAIPSGAGVALSILGGNAGSLVGVAISASLLPPAVNGGMCWAFAFIRSLGDGTSGEPKIKLTDYSSHELVEIGAISMTLTLINIFIIFVMGVIILKVKEVAPKTGTASTTNFWKKDLKATRQLLTQHTDDSFTASLLTDISKKHGVDLTSHETIKSSSKNTAVARDLKKMLTDLRNDRGYSAVSSRLIGKSRGDPVNDLMDKLENVEEEKQPRFQVQRVYKSGATIFPSNSRFMINELQEDPTETKLEMSDTTSLLPSETKPRTVSNV